MNWSHRAVKQKAANWLQLLVAVGMLLFVYMPYFDHWLGHGAETRPHTHTYFTVPSTFPFEETHDDHEGHDSHEDENEEGYLCLLNIDASLGLLLCFHLANKPMVSVNEPADRQTLPAYVSVDEIFLPTVDPPPNHS